MSDLLKMLEARAAEIEAKAAADAAELDDVETVELIPKP